MSDSQATEIVDLISDESDSESCAEGGPTSPYSGGTVAGSKRQRSPLKAAEVPPAEIPALCMPLQQHNATLKAPLDGISLIHLSVSPDDDAALDSSTPEYVAMVLPQLNPGDKCLSLQQLLHPHLKHTCSTTALEGLLATTFVGGVPSALRPIVYGHAGPPRRVSEEEIATPAAPVCPVTLVKHRGDRKGQSTAAVLDIPSTTGHSLCVVHPPLPRSQHYGTAHSKVILLRWGAGVLHPHGTLRVIVLTANLCDYDLQDCYQCAWAQDFPIAPGTLGGGAAQKTPWTACGCGEVHHRLRTAAGSTDHGAYLRRALVGGMQVPSARMDALLGEVDWTGAAVDFVATVAGHWSDTVDLLGNGLYRLAVVRGGQAAAATALCSGKHPPPGDAEPPPAGAVQRVWSQVSSLGSLLDSSFNLSHLLLAANGCLDGRKWGKQGPHASQVSRLVPHCDIALSKQEQCVPGSGRGQAQLHRLVALATQCAPPTAAQRRAGNMSPLWTGAAARSAEFVAPVKLFWPSVRFIRGTRHRSVGNVLMQAQHWGSPSFPQAAVHAFQLNPKWHVESGGGGLAATASGGAASGPPARGPATPRCSDGLASPLSSHTKLLGPQVSGGPTATPGPWLVGGPSRLRQERDWLYVGSHNLSRSAWGALQKSTAHGGAVTMSCNNYEFGVVFRPVFLEQKVTGTCTCSLEAGAPVSRPHVPPFTFVHDLGSATLQQLQESPWTQQQIASDQQAMMVARMAAGAMGHSA